VIDCWSKGAYRNCWATTYKTCPQVCPFRETDFAKYTSALEQIISGHLYLGNRAAVKPYLAQLREAYVRAGLRLPPGVGDVWYGLLAARLEDIRRGRRGGGGENSRPREVRARDNRLPETVPTPEEKRAVAEFWAELKKQVTREINVTDTGDKV
jgi:hypothetical protein